MGDSMRVALVAALATVVGLAYLVAADDPFTGTWKLNLAKSNLPPPLPQSVTTYVQCDGQSINVREETVDDNGQRHTASIKARFDGREYPLIGTPRADTVVYERLDALTIKGTSRKNGKVLVHETVVLSPDGRTLTTTYSGADAEGKAVIGTAVFEKQ
jgi:hypothetical protein